MKKKFELNGYVKIPEMRKLFRMMKTTSLFLLISATCAFANESYSQTKTLNLSMEKATVKEVLSKIEDQSEFYFMYSSKFIDVDREVSVNVKDKKIETVLDLLFARTNVNYTIKDKFIVLTTSELSGSGMFSAAKQKPISGKVADSYGFPLPGVSVIVKGTTNGTVTDINGDFSLSGIPENATLQFSFVGMKTQEIQVAGQTNINVTMEEDAIGIEEVVAVGYGTQKKVNLTGAVSVATAERLENRPIVSVGEGLQGVIPNLNISIQNGDPTTSADFNVRGFESINGGEPLILVDNVPMDIDGINPNDIESVNVLKDASASAIYGARGAFGVVLIETKKGKGKMKVTLGSEFSLGKPIVHLDPVSDPYVYMTKWNEAYTRTTGSPRYNTQEVGYAAAWVENPTTENAWKVVNGALGFYGSNDYKSELLTDFMIQNKHDLTISGGAENASYYVSFGYVNKPGWLKDKENNEQFKRYNILMKYDFKLNDWLSLDEEISFNSELSDKPHYYHANVNINSLVRLSPMTALTFPDLEYYLEPGDHDKYEEYIGMYFDSSMLPYLKHGGRETFTTSDLWLNQGITLTPLKGLIIRGKFSYQKYYKNYQDVCSNVDMVSANLASTEMIVNGWSDPDWISNTNTYNQYYALNSYAEYTMEQSSDHYLKGMVGFNQEWAYNTSVSAKAYDLLMPDITDISATTGTQTTDGGKSSYALRGAFYRINYIFKDKYLLESSGRYDLTSRFAKDSRSGFFPSFSAGWRISNEPFMSGAKAWIDNLKLRGSYGELGNQMVGNYAYISSMGTGTSNYLLTSGLTSYVSPGGLVSSTLTWEKTVTTNFGFDAMMLGQKLDISADIYTRDTKNMLMSVSYPDLLGTSAPKQNAADLRTKGWELSITWRDRLKVGHDVLGYGLTFILSDNQSEITKYENPSGSLSDYYVGRKIGEIWGFKTAGIFQSDDDVNNAPSQAQVGSNWQAGDIQYADLDGDEEISYGSNTLDDPGDQTIIGNTTARYSFGINPELKYKNWTLNVFFQGLFRDYLPETEEWQCFYPYNTNALQKWDLTDTWSEDNRDAYFAAPHISTDDDKNILGQSRYVQNAAYIRLKNLMLNYNLPLNLVSKIGASRAQVYFSGMDLWEFTKMRKPLDPESIYTTTQEYYKQRRFTFGLKITF